MFVRVKTYILLIFSIGLLVAYYALTVPQPDRQLPASLIDLNQTLIHQAGTISTTDGELLITELRGKENLTSIENRMIELIDEADIQRIFLGNRPSVRVTYFTDDYFYYLTNRYYIYTSDDYTEETQVASIEQAIGQLKDKSIYRFCEPADHPHWFVCVSED